MPILNKLTRLAKPTARQESKKTLATVPPANLPRVKAGPPDGEVKGQDPIAYKVMLKPHVTEKSMRLTDDNQYTFRVRRDVTRKEIKQAIEDIYKVNVVKVRIINVKKKEKRVGKTLGWKKGFKKAIVRIKAGQKIEFMPK